MAVLNHIATAEKDGEERSGEEKGGGNGGEGVGGTEEEKEVC